MTVPRPDRDPPEDLSAETIAARGGWAPEFVTRPSSPPLYLTTAFDLDDFEQLSAVAAGQQPGYIYMRDGHPNHAAFASDVARLEGAEAGVVTSSGMGGFAAACLALARTGDHLLAADQLYGRTAQLLKWLQEHFGIEVSEFPAAEPERIPALLRPQTRFCIVESISNPLVDVADLPAIVRHLGDVPLMVDNTFATPCLLRPLEHGASLVWHSASKYLNGHGDAMVGVIVGRSDLVRSIRATVSLVGMNANPFECWLASRGMRTLSLRVERSSATAAQLALRLREHPHVMRVAYPGLTAHPSHDIATRLMSQGFGGMLAFEVTGGRAGANDCIRRLQHAIPFSPTLADARTTLSHPVSTSHKFISAQQREAAGITEGLIRLSVGLESVDDLWRELSTALASNPSAQRA